MTWEELQKREEEIRTKISGILGGRLKSVASGGAPTSKAVLDFLQKCFPKCSVSNGYGSTETAGILSGYHIAPFIGKKTNIRY